MGTENHTSPTVFSLVKLSDIPELQSTLFFLFLLFYIITVFGNLIIILAVRFSPKLHTPMYFHLTSFSFLDICYISVTVPKMLSNLIAKHSTISFYGCAIQLYSYLSLAGTECYILAAMAYDQYNAICHPLLYITIMNTKRCIQLIAGSWIIGTGNSAIHTSLTFMLHFCESKINSFFCDAPPLLKLACTDTWINELVIFTIGDNLLVCSFLLTMMSYIQIISAIIKIHSTSGRRKAFSTCVSHFIVVAIFYGSGIFMYLRPKTSYAMNRDRLIAVMYTVIAPLLNPFIYSLRNNELKTGVRKIMYGILVRWKV